MSTLMPSPAVPAACPAPRFAVGQRVRVCMQGQDSHGHTGTIGMATWHEQAGKMPGSWIYWVDFPTKRPRSVWYWERFLVEAVTP